MQRLDLSAFDPIINRLLATPQELSRLGIGVVFRIFWLFFHVHVRFDVDTDFVTNLAFLSAGL
jgi:hypothetical protein